MAALRETLAHSATDCCTVASVWPWWSPWTVELKAAGLAGSYVYALHNRLSQLMSDAVHDAVHDGILVRHPCSRRTIPGAGKPHSYVATTDQVWALHDAVAEHLRPAILLGAFVGLRTAEAVGLRVGGC